MAKRVVNFTLKEKKKLNELVKAYAIVESKAYKTSVLQQKKTAWESITKAFNRSFPESKPRDRKMLIGLWRRMKLQAKSNVGQKESVNKGTGGGSPGSPLSKVDENVGVILGDSPNPLENPYDDEGEYSEEQNPIEHVATLEVPVLELQNDSNVNDPLGPTNPVFGSTPIHKSQSQDVIKTEKAEYSSGDEQSSDSKKDTNSDVSTCQITNATEKKFHCEECGKPFSRKGDLKRHMLTHTGEKKFPCRFCEKSFSNTSHLHSHYKVHSNEKPFECEKCDARFSFQLEWKKHKENHIQVTEPMGKKFVCHICGRLISSKRNLYHHLPTHTGEKSFSCYVCGKYFSTKKYLVAHLLIHSGEKPHSCEQCGASFIKKSSLNIHMATHFGERNHACVQCGKKFLRKDKLRVHMLSHTGEKAFNCNDCDKSFTRKYSLTQHMLIHTRHKS